MEVTVDLFSRKMLRRVLYLVLLIFQSIISVKSDKHIQEIHVWLYKFKDLQPNSLQYVDNVYEVLPNEPLHIIFKYDYRLTNVTCWTHIYQYNIRHFIPNFYGNNTRIIIESVANYMSDTWKCIVYEKHTNYTVKKLIYFDVNVKDAKPPQMIVVNDVILPAQKESATEYIGEYYYQRDDEVNVACISSNNYKCAVVLHKLDASDEPLSLTSNVHYRFNFTTEFVTDMVCTCFTPNKLSVAFTVKFIIQNNFNIMKLKINALTVRGHRDTQDDKNYYIFINHAYFLNEAVFNIACDVRKLGYYLLESYESINITRKHSTNRTVDLQIAPNKTSLITLSTRHNVTSLNTETLTITFKPLNLYKTSSLFISGNRLLKMNFTLDDENQEHLWILAFASIIALNVAVCIWKLKRRDCFEADTKYDITAAEGQLSRRISTINSSIRAVASRWKAKNSNYGNMQNCDNSPIASYSAEWEGSSENYQANVQELHMDADPVPVNDYHIYNDNVNEFPFIAFVSGDYAQVVPRNEREQIIYPKIVTNDSANNSVPQRDVANSEICFNDNSSVIYI